MQLPRVLFFLPSLPRDTVSVRGLREGSEATSGSHSSSLLIADGLAARGHSVGVFIHGGQKLTGSAVQVFDNLAQGLVWSGRSGKVVWCSWGDEGSLASLRAAATPPLMWVHTGVIPGFLRLLEQGQIAGLITVSDSARLPSLHSSHYRRIGRAYNPLGSFFAAAPKRSTAPRSSPQLVFAGYLGESKGAHRVLQLWPQVREQLPEATLVLAGSGRLYGDRRPLGPLSVAEPDFEARYLRPLVERFGSLAASGVTLAGLLSPRALRDLYRESTLGLANLNWDGDTETFCCSAVEMLASSLPVFGVARGALPETIGHSGGAFLAQTPDLRASAGEVARLLRAPDRLAAAGRAGRQYVLARYSLERSLEHWEKLLASDPQQLHARTGRWAGPRGVRFWAEAACGRLQAGRGLEACMSAVRTLRALAARRAVAQVAR